MSTRTGVERFFDLLRSWTASTTRIPQAIISVHLWMRRGGPAPTWPSGFGVRDQVATSIKLAPGRTCRNTLSMGPMPALFRTAD
jgi:hypothetical protein